MARSTSSCERPPSPLRGAAGRLRRAATLVLVPVLVAACAAAPSGPVATVEGVEIPRELLEGWVREATDANENLDAVGLQADLLGRVIQQRVIDAVLVERGLTVDPSAVAGIRADIATQVGGEASLVATLVDIGFPEDYFEGVFLAVEASVDALVRSLAEGRTLETRTARHILVETRAEAAEIVALLEDGADFATLAQERSQDPGSGAQGGDLGPQRRGAFVPPFDDAVWSASLGTVLDPVESEFGFHVIEVTAEAETPAADLGPQERRGLVAAELDEILGGAIAAAEVTVDPTIGTWDGATGAIAPATE